MMKLAGSDASFAFLCFGFVSFVLGFVVLYSFCKFLYTLRSYQSILQSLYEWKLWILYPFQLGRVLWRHPKFISLSFEYVRCRTWFFTRAICPLVLKKCIRFKVILVFLFFFLLSIVMYQTLTYDPHSILGVPRNADHTMIRKQYRKLSLQYHPDKNRAPEARAIYAEVRRAYKALVDTATFEEELASQTAVGEISVGLPSFFLDAQYRKFAAPLLLGALFLFPVTVIYMLMNTDPDAAFRKVGARILLLQKELDYWYTLLGDPSAKASQDAKPEDLLAEFNVSLATTPQEQALLDERLVVISFYIAMCNDEIRATMQRLVPILVQHQQQLQQTPPHLRHRQGAAAAGGSEINAANLKLAETSFPQFYQLHMKKQELVGGFLKLTEKPKKQALANLIAHNKRIAQVCENIRTSTGGISPS